MKNIFLGLLIFPCLALLSMDEQGKGSVAKLTREERRERRKSAGFASNALRAVMGKDACLSGGLTVGENTVEGAVYVNEHELTGLRIDLKKVQEEPRGRSLQRREGSPRPGSVPPPESPRVNSSSDSDNEGTSRDRALLVFQGKGIVKKDPCTKKGKSRDTLMCEKTGDLVKLDQSMRELLGMAPLIYEVSKHEGCDGRKALETACRRLSRLVEHSKEVITQLRQQQEAEAVKYVEKHMPPQRCRRKRGSNIEGGMVGVDRQAPQQKTISQMIEEIQSIVRDETLREGDREKMRSLADLLAGKLDLILRPLEQVSDDPPLNSWFSLSFRPQFTIPQSTVNAMAFASVGGVGFFLGLIAARLSR